VAIDPGRIVTIALKGRINDWPPAGQLGDTAETCPISVPGFDFGSIELGCPAAPKPRMSMESK
jgi:hypothetical protein